MGSISDAGSCQDYSRQPSLYGPTSISATTVYVDTASKEDCPHLLKRIILTDAWNLSTGDSSLALSGALVLGLLLKSRYPSEGESLSQHLGMNEVMRSQSSPPIDSRLWEI